ncbi:MULTISPECIES: hypothetical protein [Enterococcaceae]|uniref:hypothetical protein n=1 Tax=Enterococcaceae TaxID=81852 RepID=UPI000E46D95A|nr:MULTISPECIES: hypothetical protein [Enterococcaceae]MCI0129834.1 hypothetical protein [Vagococcus sp. CY53-2]RGI32004.1 hypothetical protein DXC12_01505 [Melissococcus sp. OM08-11BH]UNM88687.1 hypothetical protein MN187_05150 [Vagococcus sp. CY52-2]
MTEFKRQVKKLFHSLKKVNWLDMIKSNKRFVIIISLITLLFVVMSVFVSAVRPTIREKQLHAISELQSDNKQVIPTKETDIQTVLSDKESHIVAVIDAKGNPSLSTVEKLLTQKTPLETIDWKINYIQPIYNFTDIAKQYKLTAKNNFIVIEDGKEKGRYSFDKLTGGLEVLDEKLIAIIEPKIARKKPKRIKVAKKVDDSLTNSTTDSSARKKTKEIIFE